MSQWNVCISCSTQCVRSFHLLHSIPQPHFYHWNKHMYLIQPVIKNSWGSVCNFFFHCRLMPTKMTHMLWHLMTSRLRSSTPEGMTGCARCGIGAPSQSHAHVPSAASLDTKMASHLLTLRYMYMYTATVKSIWRWTTLGTMYGKMPHTKMQCTQYILT